MIQLIHWPFDQSWQLIINLPGVPIPEDPGWWQWWYLVPIFAVWSMGVGVTAKLVYAWDRLPQWDHVLPAIWPLGIPYYIGSRFTKRWLVWRDYRKNCKLAKTAK